MKILVMNAGSSSMKYQLLDMNDESLLAKGVVERIGEKVSKVKHQTGKGKTEKEMPIPTHDEAAQLVLNLLTDPELGVVASMAEIGAVGHRVLHGGAAFSESVIINDAVKAAIEECIPLGPLHNPANLKGIQACEKVMPNTPQVAVFDTAFHQTMPAKAYQYGVSKEYREKLKIRRYGFHGTSHRYVAKRACEFMGVPQQGTKMIICHLGNGSSLSAVKDGKCMDTSMGLTPLEGLIMGTRSGSLDPAVVQFIVNNSERLGKKMDVDQVLNVLNKESGLLGISGKCSDMRDIVMTADAGDADCALARDMVAYSVKKHIGSYAAALNGVDMIVFTAGIGENNYRMREYIMEGMDYLGCRLDKEKNAKCADGHAFECVISTDDSTVKVVVVPTDEELMIARDTLALVTE